MVLVEDVVVGIVEEVVEVVVVFLVVVVILDGLADALMLVSNFSILVNRFCETFYDKYSYK